jgi:hypothetical protein
VFDIFVSVKENNMSEFTQASRLWTGGLGLHIGQNPAKTFSFSGSVPAVLGFYRKDGHPLTEEDIRGIAQFGAGLCRKTIGTKTWNTREDAIIEAELLGFTVVNK